MAMYPDTFQAMLRHGGHFVWNVVSGYTVSLGDTILGYFAPGAVVILAFLIALRERIRKEGFAAMKPHFMESLVEIGKPYAKAFFVVYGLIFSWSVTRAVWTDHRSFVIKTHLLSNDLSRAKSDLEVHRHRIVTSDPVFSNTTYLLQAFFRYSDTPAWERNAS